MAATNLVERIGNFAKKSRETRIVAGANSQIPTHEIPRCCFGYRTRCLASDTCRRRVADAENESETPVGRARTAAATPRRNRAYDGKSRLSHLDGQQEP